MNIEKLKTELFSRARREMGEEAGLAVDDYCDFRLAEFLKKVGEKPDEELRLVVHADFEKAVIRPSRARAKFAAGNALPVGTGGGGNEDVGQGEGEPKGDVDPADRAKHFDPTSRGDPIPARSFLDEARNEAERGGFDASALAWAEAEASEDFLIVAYLLRAVGEARVRTAHDVAWESMGWAEAFEVLMAALAGRRLGVPARKNQRPSRSQRRAGPDREAAAREAAGSAVKAAMRRIREAQKAIRAERAERA